MFRRAERKQAKLRLALCGPAGSGKTYSALLIASGLVEEGKVAFLDTEAGSGELYADLVEYDYRRLDPPFEPRRYVEAIHSAEESGYQVMIIDSLSHAWSGTGGILDLKDRATKASRSGNSFAAWREVTPMHNALVDAILRSEMHLLVCMRTKTAWEVQEDARGRKRPVKIGLKPEQREGLEYEFTTVLDLSVDGHIATASKDRTGIFDGTFIMPTAETGKQLRRWLESGTEVEGESKTMMEELLEEMKTLEDPWALDRWARREAERIVRLLPKHREQMRAEFRSRLAELRSTERAVG